MKSFQLPVKILLVLIWSLLTTDSVRSQTGNMSDITLPNPNEIINGTPTDGNTPADSNTADGTTPTDGNTPADSNTADGTTPTDGNTPTDSNTADGATQTDGNTPTDSNTADGATQTDGNTADGATQTDGVTPTDSNTADGATPIDGVTPTDSNTAVGETTPTDSNTANQNSNQAVQEKPEVIESSSDAKESPAQANTPATEDSQATEKTDAPEEVTKDTNVLEKVEVNETADSQKVESEIAPEEVTDESVATEKPTQEEEEVAKDQEEKEAAEEKNSDADLGQLDRVAYETQFQNAPADLAIQMQEELQLTQLISSSGLQIYGSVPTVKDISRRLAELEQQTGKKAAFINISLQKNQLESFAVLPDETKSAAAKSSTVASSELKSIDLPQSKATTIRKTIKDTSRKDVIATATQFREEVSNARNLKDTGYMESGQKLYNVLIKPLEAQLQANDIDILVFSMDSGLRLLPLAALYDGKQFLVEKYATAIVPSFGLTDTRYVSPAKSSILAMGASEFTDQASLPTMGIELETIISNPRKGEAFLNEQFTIPNFIAQNSRKNSFSIIHLGTHAEFKAGDLSDSYIQFYDDKLRIPQLQNISTELGWDTANTPIELLVLSACDTAIGDEKAELGFAGLAVQAGVKSALASLWYVSDLGTLALMGEFYNQLDSTLIKAEALRQTQLEMLHGKVNIDDRRVDLSNGEKLTLPKEFPEGSLSLAHPYFWSSFTLIGNWN